jgi:hypothetical protein
LAANLCEAILKVCGHTVAICDRDSVIAATGPLKRELDGKPLSADLETLMQSRQVQQPATPAPVSPAVPGADAVLVAPILVNGDLNGCVALLDDDTEISELEVKLAQMAAVLLSKEMED